MSSKLTRKILSVTSSPRCRASNSAWQNSRHNSSVGRTWVPAVSSRLSYRFWHNLQQLFQANSCTSPDPEKLNIRSRCMELRFARVLHSVQHSFNAVLRDETSASALLRFCKASFMVSIRPLLVLLVCGESGRSRSSASSMSA